MNPIVRHGRPAKHTHCTVEACTGHHLARGLCAKHYHQAKKSGLPPKLPIARTPASIGQRPQFTPRRSTPTEARSEREIQREQDRAAQASIEAGHVAQRAAILGRLR